MDKLSYASRILLGLPKTLFFNFKFFPFQIAVKLPVLLSIKTKWGGVFRDSIRINSHRISFGMIKIGIVDGSDGILYDTRCYISIDRNSQIIFNGDLTMAPGATLKAIRGGVISIGSGCTFNYHCTLLSKKAINVGNNVMFGWNVLINDGDGQVPMRHF